MTSSLNSSSGPAVCRVCLCSESSIPYLGKTAGEPLISPCHCKGSCGLYHRSCLEHWLSTSRTTLCEICKFSYEIETKYLTFFAYFRRFGWLDKPERYRSPITDIALLLVMWLLFGSSVIGGCYSMTWEDRPADNFGSMIMLLASALLLIAIFTYTGAAIRGNYGDYRHWREKNQIVYVIDQLESEAPSKSSSTLREAPKFTLKERFQAVLSSIGIGRRREPTPVVQLADVALVDFEYIAPSSTSSSPPQDPTIHHRMDLDASTVSSSSRSDPPQSSYATTTFHTSNETAASFSSISLDESNSARPRPQTSSSGILMCSTPMSLTHNRANGHVLPSGSFGQSPGMDQFYSLPVNEEEPVYSLPPDFTSPSRRSPEL